MDEELKDRLPGIGVDADAYPDAFEVWLRLRARYGPEVNLIDLYKLVAHPRGLEAHELPMAERKELCARGLPAAVDGFEIVAGSDRAESEPIEIEPYDETWPQLYAAWRERLATALVHSDDDARDCGDGEHGWRVGPTSQRNGIQCHADTGCRDPDRHHR